MAHTVGDKGQVVIEKPIREALGVQPGSIAVQSLVEDHVEIRFYPPEHTRSLRGVLAKYAKNPISPDEWQAVREQAWADAIAEDEEP